MTNLLANLKLEDEFIVRNTVCCFGVMFDKSSMVLFVLIFKPFLILINYLDDEWLLNISFELYSYRFRKLLDARCLRKHNFLFVQNDYE